MLQKLQKMDLIFSSLEGETIPFDIGDSSVIIDIIRKRIYSFPLRTMVGEYLSNAFDSCREAGKDHGNIKVTLPTELAPEFIVRDYGVGMSDERIKEVFVRYGISTKRTSNSQLGFFGIGAKSAWAYTDSFIVESFHNGTHREYVADIGKNKEGRLLLFKETPTTEENGVLIKIPVNPKDVQEFTLAYIRATFLWEKRPKVNKELVFPYGVYDLGHIKIYKSHSAIKGDYVYLNAGGIPFAANSPDTELNDLCRHNDLFIVIDANPSKMDISANREGYSNTAYTKKLLEKIHTGLTDYVDKKFEDAPYSEHIRVYRDLGVLSKFRKNDKDKPYTLEKHRIHFSSWRFFHLQYRMPFARGTRSILSFSEFSEIFLCRAKETYDTLPSLTVNALKYIKRLYPENSKAYVFFQTDLSDDAYKEISEILGAKRYVEDILNEMQAEKLPAPPEAPKKKEKILPENLTVWTVRQSHRASHTCVKWKIKTIKELQASGKEAIFYGVGCNAWFYRTITMSPFNFEIVTGNTGVIEKIEKLKLPNWVRMTDVRMTDDGIKDYLTTNPSVIEWYRNGASLRKHPVVAKLIERVGTEIIAPTFDMKGICAIVKQYFSNTSNSSWDSYFKEVPFEKNEFEKFAERYPLLSSLNEYSFKYSEDLTKMIEHLNLYINAIDGEMI